MAGARRVAKRQNETTLSRETISKVTFTTRVGTGAVTDLPGAIGTGVSEGISLGSQTLGPEVAAAAPGVTTPSTAPVMFGTLPIMQTTHAV